MKKILKFIIEIPNSPIKWSIAIYVLIRIIRETGYAEFMSSDASVSSHKGLTEYLQKLYPMNVQYIVAGFFYSCLIVYLVK